MNADDRSVTPPRPPVERLGRGRLRAWAPAKLNLDLHVGPRRRDGFHPLDSLVAKITLYDRVDLSPRDDGELRLTCEGADCGPAEQNLALRAAGALAKRGRDDAAAARAPAGRPGVDIALAKGIPPGAGLGGGSSDAAAVLRALNDLWALHLPSEELSAVAAGLGSDVPLFLGPPAARMTGRGETLRPVRIRPFAALVFLADLACPTGAVYRALDESPAGGGALPADDRREALIRRVESSPPSAWRAELANDLADPACVVCPALGELRRELSHVCPVPVHVTGSGSGLFCLCDDADELVRVRAALPDRLARLAVAVRGNPW